MTIRVPGYYPLPLGEGGFKSSQNSGVRRHVFLWVQKLKNYLSNSFEILSSHSLRHGDVQVIFSLETESPSFEFALTSALHLFCLCKVKRHYLLPGKLGIYCFLTGTSCHSAAKRSNLLTCISSIYFLYADVTASFLLVTAFSIGSFCTLVKYADTWFCCEQKSSMSCLF